MIKSAAVGLAAAVLVDPQTALEWIVLVGAAGTAWFWIFRNIVRPGAGAFLRTYKAVGALEDLPDFMRETRERLDAGSSNFRALEERLARAETAAGEGREAAAQAANVGAAVARELDVSVRGDLSDT